MVRDEIVALPRGVRQVVDFPLAEGVTATRLRQDRDGGVPGHHVRGRAHRRPGGGGHRPVPGAPHAADRRAAPRRHHAGPLRRSTAVRASCPTGEVLVVGTGQSGCQIAEDLHLAGRRVHLSVGSAPRVARRYRGRDVVAWLEDMGYYRKAISEFTDADAVRFRANHYVTGRDGGRDIDLRAFARDGMRLYGRLPGRPRRRARRSTRDLRRNLDAADAASESIKDSIDAYIAAQRHRRRRPRPGTRRCGNRPIEPRRARPAARPASPRWSGATGFGAGPPVDRGPGLRRPGLPDPPARRDQLPGAVLPRAALAAHLGLGAASCGVGADAEYLLRQIAAFGARQEVRWIAGTPASTYPHATTTGSRRGRWHDLTATGATTVSDAHRHLGVHARLPVLRRPAGPAGHRGPGDHRRSSSRTWTPRAPSGPWSCRTTACPTRRVAFSFNELCVEAAAGDDRIRAALWVSPLARDAERTRKALALAGEPGVRALKLSFLLGGRPDDAACRPQLDEIFAAAREHDLVVHVHTSPGAASDIDAGRHAGRQLRRRGRRCTWCTSAAG